MRREVLLIFFLILFPVQATIETWSLSPKIQPGQRFVWFDYDVFYDNVEDSPMEGYSNHTLVVTDDPKNMEVRAMNQEDYFDFFIDGEQQEISMELFQRDQLGFNYIQPTEVNNTSNYFYIYEDTQGTNHSIEGDFFYHSSNNTFRRINYFSQSLYHIPTGISIYFAYKFTASDTGEVTGGRTRILIEPVVDYDLSEPTNDRSSDADDNTPVVIPFPHYSLMVALVILPCIRRMGILQPKIKKATERTN